MALNRNITNATYYYPVVIIHLDKDFCSHMTWYCERRTSLSMHRKKSHEASAMPLPLPLRAPWIMNSYLVSKSWLWSWIA